jgi:hypothetical protein
MTEEVFVQRQWPTLEVLIDASEERPHKTEFSLKGSDRQKKGMS